MINQCDMICDALEKVEYMALRMYFHLMERVKPPDGDENTDSWHMWESNTAHYREAIKAIQNCLRSIPTTDDTALLQFLERVKYFLDSNPFTLRVIPESEIGIQWDAKQWETKHANDVESSAKVICKYIRALEYLLDNHNPQG